MYGVFFKDGEDFFAVGLVRLIASGAQRRARCVGDLFEEWIFEPVEVYEIFGDDAGDSKAGSDDVVTLFFSFQDDSHKSLIDDGRWSATLGDEDVHGSCFLLWLYYIRGALLLQVGNEESVIVSRYLICLIPYWVIGVNCKCWRRILLPAE